MNPNPDELIWLVPGLGMMIVAVLAAVYWCRAARCQVRWLWVGAGLWTVSVALKVVCALLTNGPVIGLMKEHLPYSLLVVGGGLYVGIQSSVFEMGFTLLAVLIWRQLGRDADRAIGVGVGAGAFEALLLGIATFAAMLAMLLGVPGLEAVRAELETAGAVTPLLWLVAPVERIIAILCHASSRALILLGVVKGKPMMVFWGFLIFTLIDSIAGAAHVSGRLGTFSMWWIEVAILPVALVSIPILRWCCKRWPHPGECATGPTADGKPEGLEEGQ